MSVYFSSKIVNLQMCSQRVEVITEKLRLVFVNLPVHSAALQNRTPTSCVTSGPVRSGYECAGWIFHLPQQKKKKADFFFPPSSFISLFSSVTAALCFLILTPPPPLLNGLTCLSLSESLCFFTFDFQHALSSTVTHETCAEEPVGKSHVPAMHHGSPCLFPDCILCWNLTGYSSFAWNVAKTWITESKRCKGTGSRALCMLLQFMMTTVTKPTINNGRVTKH